MRRAVCLLLLAAPGPAVAQPAVPAAEPYKAVAERLTAAVEREARDKKLPAVSVALVDGGRVVWAAGFGKQDRLAPATAETVYRVGSVSKLFTDVAVMQLVEAGKLDLDAPVTKYLPGFRPRNPFDDKSITLRHLMAHRSGLVREPPVGHYFDPTGPTLAATVESLNRTTLVYPPGEREKYSNAAVAVVGRVLEVVGGKPFPDLVAAAVLDPLGMRASSFVPTPAAKARLAAAVMGTPMGREFPAPTFELGEAPAGSLYTTVLDLGRFMGCLFADGKTADGRLLSAGSLAEMLKPQFADAQGKSGFGLGFQVGELDGRRRVGHGGAVYGFATELAALPDDKLGAVVVASRDFANAVTERLADYALRLMRAAKAGQPLPDFPHTDPLPPALARELAGTYRGGDRWLEVAELAGRAYLSSDRGGVAAELRSDGPDLRGDSPAVWGPVVKCAGGKLTVNGREYEKAPDRGPPPAPPAKWAGLIGEYGWDHNTLYILERGGKLHALIEWVALYPLTEESDTVFAFPDYGLYHGEKLLFTRDRAGRATKVVAAEVAFDRRKIDGENGETFRVVPRRPVAELRAAALAATPPQEDRKFAASELVDLTEVEPGVKLDVRYATDNNFLAAPFYTSARAFLQRPAAAAVGRVHRGLKPAGYGLLVHDAYRPWYVTKMFWDGTPERFHGFVADPATGSRHNRGCAVDLTLFDLAAGKPVEMVGGYDEFSDRAYPAYPGGTSRQRWHRDLLRRAMEADGFAVNPGEWWHFDHREWPNYPLANKRFEDLPAGGR